MPRRRPTTALGGRRAKGGFRKLWLVPALVGAVLMSLVSPAAAVDPTVTSVSPNGGALEGGVNVLVTGKDFTGTTSVKFGTVDATSFAVISDTQLVAEVPAASAAGSQTIIVNNGTANTTGASYKYADPTVTKVEPGFADADTKKIITITGTGFTGATAAEVKFGTNVSTKIWVVSDTKIIAESPITDSGNSITVNNGVVDVTVSSNSVASATSDKTKFLFTPAVPAITQLGDSAQANGTADAAVGSTLKIRGTNLYGVSKVKFGSTAVTSGITIATDGTSLDVTVPNRSSGPVEVQVENAAGISVTNLKTRFPYYSTVAPKVNSAYPDVFDKAASGGGGTLLVNGTGFTGVTAAKVTVICGSTNITPTSATAVSDTALILVIPGNADTAATCDLKVENPLDNTKTGTLTGGVRYI